MSGNIPHKSAQGRRRLRAKSAVRHYGMEVRETAKRTAALKGKRNGH